MAVIDWFKCTVSVDGSVAEEYDEDPEEANDNSTPNVVTKYIEAVSGANFRLNFEVKPNYDFNSDLLTWNILLDGEWKTGAPIEKSRYNVYAVFKDSREGASSGKGDAWFFRKFKFGDLEISDAPLQNHPKLSDEKIKDLGTITVKVWRQSRGETFEQELKLKDGGGGPVPEKALKGRALTLNASLGDPVASVTPRLIRGTNLDKHAVATFHFKYRSKKSLRDELIVPRTPPPEERPVEELTPEEMRELLKKQRENAIKQEQTQRKIKRERPESMQMPSRSYKVARNEDGIEVVNLADDDDEASNPRSQTARSNGRVATVPTANGYGIVDLEDFELED